MLLGNCTEQHYIATILYYSLLCVLLTCPCGGVGQSPQLVSTKRHKLPGGCPPDCYGTPD